MAIIIFKGMIPYIDGKPVKNADKLLGIMETHFKEKRFNEYPTSYSICTLHYVPTGDYITVVSDDLKRKLPYGNCMCGVPHDVHGTCCGFENAIAVSDENGNIIDDRHPFYGKSASDYFAQRFA